MKRINAIYARQSVDRADSISIESQIEFCKYELKGGASGSIRIKDTAERIQSDRSCSSFWRISAEGR